MAAADRPPRQKGQIRDGLRYVRRTPALLLPLLMLTVTGMLAYEFPVTLPLVARGAFHGGAGAYGAMAALMAVGAVVGGLVIAGSGNRRRAETLALAGVGWGVAILAAALAPDLAWELVVMPFVGYGSISFNSLSKTAMQLASAPSMRGRVMALWSMAWGGTTVVGGPLVGWVAQEFGAAGRWWPAACRPCCSGSRCGPRLRRIDHGAAANSPAP